MSRTAFYLRVSTSWKLTREVSGAFVRNFEIPLLREAALYPDLYSCKDLKTCMPTPKSFLLWTNKIIIQDKPCRKRRKFGGQRFHHSKSNSVCMCDTLWGHDDACLSFIFRLNRQFYINASQTGGAWYGKVMDKARSDVLTLLTVTCYVRSL
jgi:hypothetical protein